MASFRPGSPVQFDDSLFHPPFFCNTPSAWWDLVRLPQVQDVKHFELWALEVSIHDITHWLDILAKHSLFLQSILPSCCRRPSGLHHLTSWQYEAQSFRYTVDVYEQLVASLRKLAQISNVSFVTTSGKVNMQYHERTLEPSNFFSGWARENSKAMVLQAWETYIELLMLRHQHVRLFATGK